jgi:hypothetical protein
MMRHGIFTKDADLPKHFVALFNFDTEAHVFGWTRTPFDKEGWETKDLWRAGKVVTDPAWFVENGYERWFEL